MHGQRQLRFECSRDTTDDSRFRNSFGRTPWTCGGAILLALTCGLSGARGQFREVETDTTVETPPVVNLVPTDEAFLAPIVDAAEFRTETEEPGDKPSKKAAKPKKTTPTKVKPVKPADAGKNDPAPVEAPKLVPVEVESTPAESKQEPVAQTEEPAVAPAAQRESRFKPAVFQDVQPGRTTHQQLVEQWGKPTQTRSKSAAEKLLIYHVEGLKQVNVTVRQDVVSTILVHLDQVQPVDQVEQQLQLKAFSPVPIPDDVGDVLGLGYPEKGLMLSFNDNEEDPQVSAILIEKISGEMFRLRAEYDFHHQYTRSLADLTAAVELDPQDAEAYWLQAQFQDACGQMRDALKSVQKAIRLKPTNPMYRITRARLYAKSNRLATAVEEVEAVISELEMPAEVAAKAHNLLGDLLAIGNKADHHAALKQHLKAIDLATRVVDEQQFGIRRRAKQVLVSAHLSVARDIAMGNFQRQSEVVPKWLLRAAEMADEFIADDNGDELVQLDIFRETLAAYAETQINNIDATIATEEAIETSKQIIADATDDLFKMHVERNLAETLLHASRIARSRGKYDIAMKYTNNAIALLDNSKQQWDASPHGQFLESQLYFVLGSLHAMKDQDHTEAVRWYAKARSSIIASNTVSPLYSLRGHGEMYVSMGLSYWEAGDQDKAIQITQTGTELMAEAVESGSLQIDAMSVPYGNLAVMHSKMGQQDKSKEYADLVAKVEKLQQDDTIRK